MLGRQSGIWAHQLRRLLGQHPVRAAAAYSFSSEIRSFLDFDVERLEPRQLLTGSPAFEYAGSRYVAVEHGTIDEVRTAAAEIGGHLVSINSQSEQEWLTQTFQSSGETFLIGLTDQDQEGQFAWSNGDPVTYTNWAAGEPNDWHGNHHHGYMSGEDHVMMYGSGQWNDVSELASMRAIVEIPIHDGCTNLLINGSFEDTTLHRANKFVKESKVPGWQLQSTTSSRVTPKIQLIQSGRFASDGDTFLELDTVGRVYDVVYQDVATTAGQTYDLSFDLRKRVGRGRHHNHHPRDNEVQVWWDGTLLGTYSPDSTHKWNQVKATVVASQTGQTRLEFREINSGRWGGGDGVGPLIDNVKLCGQGPNSAPTLEPIADQSIPEHTELVIQAQASVPAAGQTYTFSIADGPAGASIDEATGLIRWIPDESDGPGEFDLTVRVADSNNANLFDTESLRVTVTEVNEAPSLQFVADQQAEADSVLQIQLAGSDLDIPVQTLTYSIISGPETATVNADTGAFSWTPDHDDVGEATFVVAVSDGELTTTQSFHVNVEQCNNLIVNGSFEEGPLRRGNGFYKDDAIPGWQLDGEKSAKARTSQIPDI